MNKHGRWAYAGSLYLIVLLIISAWAWREYSLEYDTRYPARIIFEHDFFTTEEGRPIHKVEAGQPVYYRKAFCVSLDDPDRLVQELRDGERGFCSAGDAVTREQTGYFGTIYGLTRGTFIDGIALPIPDRTFEVEEGCYDVVQQIVIPKTLPPGLYYLQLKFTYYRNTFQKTAGKGVTRTAKNIAFEVVE